MARLPRVAIGTIQPDADAHPVLWALMEAFRHCGLQVQSFLSQAWFPPHQGATAITGLAPRHLDSWLMSPSLCREVLLRGACAADLALVEGTFRPPAANGSDGGSLDTLCHWLDLPRLIVLDVTRLDLCRLPARPPRVEGLLLDGVTGDRHLAQVTADLGILWRIPVLGSLERSAPLTAHLRAIPDGGRPSPELCQELGSRFMGHWYPERIWRIANERELAENKLRPVCPEPMRSKLTLAVAYDEAFNGYFPETLDWLERRGATVIDFSPLRDETLPVDADVVYLGCGHPERHAAALSENHCMKAALRNHLRAGRRIYAEGGGLAYLCELMEAFDGSMRRMVGIVPAMARLRRHPGVPRPTEVFLAHSTWLGNRGDRLRGYRNNTWDLQPLGARTSFSAHDNLASEIVGSFQVVGSLLHLNFAAQPEFLRRFFHPHHPRPQPVRSWATGR